MKTLLVGFVLIQIECFCFVLQHIDPATIVQSERFPLYPKPEIANIQRERGRPERIAPGAATTIEKHPYQVSYIVDEDFLCGGFIISEDYIITAAHCLEEMQYAIRSIVNFQCGPSHSGIPGTFRRNGTIIPVASVIPHPNYSDPQFDKDVGIIKTADKIKFTDVIKPIPLAPMGRALESGSIVNISGWGLMTESSNRPPDRLMEVTLPVVDHMVCFLEYVNILTDSEFCAGSYVLGGRSTCQGDSGGAAIQDGMAVGIVSYGRGCGLPLSPSVFADIATPVIRQFIKDHTGL